MVMRIVLIQYPEEEVHYSDILLGIPKINENIVVWGSEYITDAVIEKRQREMAGSDKKSLFDLTKDIPVEGE